MRILLSKESKKELFNYLKKVHNEKSLKKLAMRLKIKFGTIQDWLYGSRYIPEKIVPLEIINDLKVLDRQENNWGNVKGGKKTYKTIVKKYGLEEIKRRQKEGGKNSIKKLKLRNVLEQKEFDINLTSPQFLEFYGALLGDGWLSKFNVKNKITSLMGISGHIVLDKKYHLYLQNISKEIFNRKGYIKEKPKYNARELQIGHKGLIDFLNKQLNFPIGPKKDLKISSKIMSLDFNYTKYVIRGIFDTDGSFFLDKTPVGRPYPTISICMRAPFLIRQLKEILSKENFKPITYHNGEELKLKGSIQLRNWMSKIGSSNPKHLDKINAHVAQLDSAKAS